MKSILKAESSIRWNRESKYCVYCGTLATPEAFFDAGNGVIVVEKYCHICNGRANLRLGAPSYHHDTMNLLKKKSSTKFIL
jgi:hypothetical protein